MLSVLSDPLAHLLGMTLRPGEILKRRIVIALRLRESTVSWPGFEHNVGDPVANAVAVLPSARIILVEGLYLLHDDHGWQHAHLFDESWFLDVPIEIAMDRLLQRHMQANAQSREIAMQRLAVNDRLNAEIVLRSRDRANWLVQNDTTA